MLLSCVDLQREPIGISSMNILHLKYIYILYISSDLTLMLGLDETMDQLIMANSVCWYCHVLRREGSHVLRRALYFEIEGQRKKGSVKRTWKEQVLPSCFEMCTLFMYAVRSEYIAVHITWNYYCVPPGRRLCNASFTDDTGSCVMRFHCTLTERL